MKKFFWIKPLIISVLLLSGVAFMGMAGARYSAVKGRDIANQTLPSLSHLALGNQHRGQAFLHLISAVNAVSHEDFQKHKTEIKRFSDLSMNEFDLYEDTIKSAENRAMYLDVMAERESYLVYRNKILLLSEAGKKDQATQELTDHLLPMYERYLSKGQKLVDLAVQDGVERTDAIRLIAIGAQIFAVFASIAIFIFGFVLGYTR